MLLVSMLFITFMMIMILIMNIIPTINLHKKMDREKNSPFECGFDPFSNSRMSFSIHFFTICLMFLIFDIEIAMILPAPLITNFNNNQELTIMISFIVTSLIIGIIIEWKEGSMNWK